MKSLKIKKIVLGGFLGLITTFGINAQELNFSVGTQLQFTSFNLEGAVDKADVDPGAGVELGVQYQLSDRWSLNSGVGFAFHNSRNFVSQVSGSEQAVDSEGESFTFNYDLNDYAERQQFNNISIPLNIQYESTGRTRFYSRAGVSYNILSNARQEASAASLETEGFFPRFNGTLTAPAFAGFGTYKNIGFSEQDFKLGNSINLTLEGGIKERINAESSFYFGIFFEYGLNDVSEAEGDNGSLSFNSQSPTDFISNGSFNAVNNNLQQVESAQIYFGGIKLRYQFSGSKKSEVTMQ